VRVLTCKADIPTSSPSKAPNAMRALTDRTALQTPLTRAPGVQTLRLHPLDFVDSDGVIETFWCYFA
jgi:hypothetical protein